MLSGSTTRPPFVAAPNEFKDLLYTCGGIGSLARDHLQREGARCILCRLEEIVEGSCFGITQKTHPRCVRCDLFDHGKPFPDDARLIVQQAGQIGPGRARLFTKPEPIGSETVNEYDWYVVGGLSVMSRQPELYGPRITSGFMAIISFAKAESWAASPHCEAIVDVNIVIFRPSAFRQTPAECFQARASFGVILRIADDHADAMIVLLCTHHERPRGRRTAQERMNSRRLICPPRL